MQPNEDDNTPDDGPQDDGSQDNPTFSSLPPEVQQQILAYVLQGKPRNPNTIQQAKTMLEADPDTVAQIMEKLGIDSDSGDDKSEADDNG